MGIVSRFATMADLAAQNAAKKALPAPNTRALTRAEGAALRKSSWASYPREVLAGKPDDMLAGEWLSRRASLSTVSTDDAARMAQDVWVEGLRGPQSWTTPSPLKTAAVGGAGAASAGSAYPYAPEFDPARDHMGEARAAPRGGFLGALADLLGGAKGFLNAPGQIPYLNQGVGDLLMGQAPELADDMSYGFSPIRGAGMAATLDPAVAEQVGVVIWPATAI